MPVALHSRSEAVALLAKKHGNLEMVNTSQSIDCAPVVKPGQQYLPCLTSLVFIATCLFFDGQLLVHAQEL